LTFGSAIDRTDDGRIEPVFVLGIDPGLSRCGYCVIDAGRSGGRVVAMGVLRPDPADAVPVRLGELLDDARALLDEYRPVSVALERVLFQVNVRTAIGVAQASGLFMAEAAARGLAVGEYSPNEVKQAVTGMGDADKVQVQQMVQRLLDLPAPPRPADVADAAAVALTHVAHTAGITSRATTGVAR
jgi:crossover junction endodeoxyribonuclease RuvC